MCGVTFLLNNHTSNPEKTLASARSFGTRWISACQEHVRVTFNHKTNIELQITSAFCTVFQFTSTLITVMWKKCFYLYCIYFYKLSNKNYKENEHEMTWKCKITNNNNKKKLMVLMFFFYHNLFFLNQKMVLVFLRNLIFLLILRSQ